MSPAGKIPATKSAPTDTVVMLPTTSMAMLGGIVSPIAADAASTATLSPGL